MTTEIVNTDIKELVKQKNKIYNQLYDLLKPEVVERIKSTEWRRKHIWDLFNEFEDELNIHRDDYERIINQMIEEHLIMKMPTSCDFGQLIMYKEFKY